MFNPIPPSDPNLPEVLPITDHRRAAPRRLPPEPVGQAQCRQCGSSKIIPDVPILDHFGQTGGPSSPAQVQVAGSPQAWIFKDATFGTIFAQICGNCGLTELYTGNFRGLYEKYEKAMGGAG